MRSDDDPTERYPMKLSQKTRRWAGVTALLAATLAGRAALLSYAVAPPAVLGRDSRHHRGYHRR